MRWLILVLLLPTAHAGAPEAVAWLEQQELRGADAAIALGAAGVDPLLFPVAFDVDVPQAKDFLAVAAAGQRTWDGRDMVAEAQDAIANVIGTAGIGDDAFLQMALRVWGQPDPDLQEALLQAQRPDGGWTCWGPSSVDCTGYALAALGGEANRPGAARAFLDAHVDGDGGVRSDNATLTTPNANSAAWYLHARIGSHNDRVLGWLRALQTPSGGFAWEEGGPENLFATLEALPWTGSFRWHTTVVAPPMNITTTEHGAIVSTDWDGAVAWRHAGGSGTGPRLELELEPGLHSIRAQGRDGDELWRTTVVVEGPPAQSPRPGNTGFIAIGVGAVLAGLYIWKRR